MATLTSVLQRSSIFPNKPFASVYCTSASYARQLNCANATPSTTTQRGATVNSRDARLLPKCKCGRPAPIGKRKCARCLSTKGFKVVQGRPSRKGSNARGTAAHKPDKIRTRRAKRQNPESLAMRPELRMSTINPARSIRKPNEEIW